MSGKPKGAALLQTIIELHYEGVREFFIRRTNSPEIADDLVQSTFLKLAQVRSLEKKCQRAYIYKVARSVYADYYAGRNRRCSASDWISKRSPDVTDMADSDQAQAARQGIEQLPEECRAILVLRLYQGYTFREASATLGVPETTLAARYNKAIRCLKKVINLVTT
ncbi:MAG: sigma-70 family RNA polymerase sigma factor [Phycisphaerales bacterium]|nr:MAG: sigma-70 family RNA polymerase sigma factor [Phycisphaerales bacterium]